ncbi:IS3 family transposase [Lutibacter sp. B2]|nr:IS3 family transposase [Lutibacter sp. B2]
MGQSPFPTRLRKKTVDEIVQCINKYQHKYTVKLICKALKFSRSTYALFRVPSKRQLEAQKLKAEIKAIYLESKKRYGAPKIQKVLESIGKIYKS